jgi:ubiquinone/menaquinone biosynthesis C-methylase UbiE
VADNVFGNVLDVGKSDYWDYGFSTIDNNASKNPTHLGNIEKTDFKDDEFDYVLCNGMYEWVDNPRKMIDEVMRIGKIGVFGMVGRDYKPYKKDWKFFNHAYEFNKYQPIKIKNFDNEYHFIICKK